MLVGPHLEFELGKKRMVQLLAIVGVSSGLFHGFTSNDTILCGASGVVFAFVALSTRRGFVKRDGVYETPITLILVLVMFLGQEVWEGLKNNDSISQMSHIIGAICGMSWMLFFIETKNTKKSMFSNLLQKVPFYYYTPNRMDMLKKKE